MGRTRRARWLALVVTVSVFLAGCSDPKAADGLPTLNVFAPTEAGAGGLVPAVGIVGPSRPYFTRILCGGTVKIGVRTNCWVFIDDAHFGKPGLTVSVDFGLFGPPFRDDWTMAPCGVCGRLYETDFAIREPFEPGQYKLRFWIRDGNVFVGRVTTTTMINVVR
jgi:hypothetical protein